MGRDKGRGRGGGRGGGKRVYIQNEEELAIQNERFASEQEARARRRADSDEEDEDDDDGDEEAGGGGPDSVFAFDRSGTKGGEGNLQGKMASMNINNPNMVKKPQPAGEAADPDAGLTRKQKEALEAQRKKEEYMRRHLAGETEEAKSDMARLAEVRKRREEAAKKRETEGRAPGMSSSGLPDDDDDDDDDDSSDEDEEGGVAKPKAAPAPAAAPTMSASQAKKKAAAAAPAEDSSAGPPKLKSMDIKKMNGDALKDALRERGLEVQGAKKDLIKRLTDYEAARS